MTFLVTTFSARFGLRMVRRDANGTLSLALEREQPPMTRDQAEQAQSWARATYGHEPGFRCSILDAETNRGVA